MHSVHKTEKFRKVNKFGYSKRFIVVTWIPYNTSFSIFLFLLRKLICISYKYVSTGIRSTLTYKLLPSYRTDSTNLIDIPLTWHNFENHCATNKMAKIKTTNKILSIKGLESRVPRRGWKVKVTVAPMAETLAVRQKRKATRRDRDDDENACFTGATKDFTSRLLFSRSVRDRASVEQRRLTRGHRTPAVSRFFPPYFPKWNHSDTRERTPLSHSATIRGTICQFVNPCNLWSTYF